MSTQKKIIHVDMDAFYASVEQRDNPALRSKPLAVGGSATKRGVIAAASYEARQFGIRSAMPSKLAVARCPHLIIVKPRFEAYRAISDQIRSIFHEFTDLVEPLALDEAYLDVTENKSGILYASTIARQIRTKIYEQTGLTASAGISYTKFLAKLASDMNKPNGLKVILPEESDKIIERLPIGKFHGIGKVTAAKMERMGIHTGADLKKLDLTTLTERFGKSGKYYYNISRGLDERQVKPNRTRKSVGAEHSFAEDLQSVRDCFEQLDTLAAAVHQRIAKHQMLGRTLTLKVKFANYTQITRSKTFDLPIQSTSDIAEEAKDLLSEVDIPTKGIRLLGIALSNLQSQEAVHSIQLEVFREVRRGLLSP